MTDKIWNPAKALAGVRLTPAQVGTVQTQMKAKGQPFDADNRFPADAVFEGGGVWGVAHLGALLCFEDVGAKWVSLGGTSAGAITAGLVAAGYSAAELADIFSDLNYMDFIKDRTFPGWDSNPGDDLESAKEIVTLLMTLWTTGHLGRYRKTKFREWYDAQLAKKGVTTFAGVFKKVDGDRVRQLRVVCTDLTHARLRILPDQMTNHLHLPLHNNDAIPEDLKDLSIAEAVACSMSIPGFFEPSVLAPDDSCIVDGGLISNFPIWLFDDVTNSMKAPEWPTFGFQLVEAGESNPQKVDSIGKLLARMFRTMMSATDGHQILGREDRIVRVDVTALGGVKPVSATAFNAEPEVLEALYRVGYEAAKDFLQNKWDWQKHVDRRMGKS